MMNQRLVNEKLQSLSFYNDKVDIIVISKQEQKEVYIAIKKVCENIGLSWATQYKKIKEHHRFSKGIIISPIVTAGGKQDTLFLHKPKFFMWLYAIKPEKVAQSIRSHLIKYQDEVELAIDHYFTQETTIPSEPLRQYDKEIDEIFPMISSQARMLAVLADEMYTNRKRIKNLENDVGRIKNKLYLENSSPSTKNYISHQQARQLRNLVKSKGKIGKE